MTEQVETLRIENTASCGIRSVSGRTREEVRSSVTETVDKIAWHPAFYGGIELELRKWKADLIFETEHELSKEALLMDMLIIKKSRDVNIDSPYGRAFRTYNIIEYKSPEDTLNIDGFYKTIGYACLYNIDNMEETTRILALGAGAITKWLFPRERRIERAPNVRNIDEYIARTDEMVDRKRGVILQTGVSGR